MRHFTVVLVVATLTAGGCGTKASVSGSGSTTDDTAGGISSAGSSTSEPMITDTRATTLVRKPVPVTSVEQVGSLPFEIGPLPPGESPRLTVDDLFPILAQDLSGRFFTTDADRASVSIKVGIITDHGGTVAGRPSPNPTFPGYVLEGGRAMCTFSGPPRSDGQFNGSVACHALLIVNGDSGDIVRSAEIGNSGASVGGNSYAASGAVDHGAVRAWRGVGLEGEIEALGKSGDDQRQFHLGEGESDTPSWSAAEGNPRGFHRRNGRWGRVDVAVGIELEWIQIGRAHV